jgi:hypothetical protein
VKTGKERWVEESVPLASTVAHQGIVSRNIAACQHYIGVLDLAAGLTVVAIGAQADVES